MRILEIITSYEFPDIHVDRSFAQSDYRVGAMKITEIVDPDGPYEAGRKYTGPIPEIKYLPVTAIERQEMDFRPEVLTVSHTVARNMDYSEPVEVTAHRWGDRNHRDSDTHPSVVLRDGHHRTAAALQTGRAWLPVTCMAINAKGEKLNALIWLSRQIETHQH